MTDIDSLVNKVMKNGPSRVFARCSCGCGGLVGRSPEEHNCPSPDVIFIRKDGWSLGAPKAFIAEAEKLWDDSWVAVLDVSDRSVRTYFQWARRAEKCNSDSA